MKHRTSISILVFCVAVLSVAAAAAGIFSSHGPGTFEHRTIRGETVTIHGRGVYRHMSADVAVQGIAQDYITLFAGVPLLLCALFLFRAGSLRGGLLLAGTCGYFLVTYLFYLLMGTYNELFLVYTALLLAGFFAFILILMSLGPDTLAARFTSRFPARFVGGFLVFNSIAVGLMWLGVIVPPLVDGSLYPATLHHYTTMVVQGLDLGILLPAAFVCGVLLARRNRFGYLFAPTYIVFLSLLMTALSAKIVGMLITGVSVGPALVIIPTINLVTIACAVLVIAGIESGR